jgi:hypothetical protein
MWKLAAVAASVILLGASNAYACACCGTTATWSERAAPLQKFERDELGRLRFAPTARAVPTNEGRNRSYRVTGSLTGSAWRIRLSGLPALTFRAPARATTFVTDLRDGKVGGGGGPLLYKELRFEGAATGPATHYRLILQGRGNNCLNAADFTHWRLELTGEKKQLAVFGDFRKVAQ